MSLPRDHFLETKALVKQLDIRDIASWLLEEGYYPEQYVLPPCFYAHGFSLRRRPYFTVRRLKGGVKLKPDWSELAYIALPKSILTQRDFAVLDPRHYHDMVFHVTAEWKLVLSHLFHKDQRIYSYSFPIPLSRDTPGTLGKLRAGRMIYEFLEMAENDLVGEAFKYAFILKTDIVNFYTSVYTHSIAWALHGKEQSRQDMFSFDSLGKKLDRLAQRSNDGRTDGIAVGPAITDLIAEILLAAIDLECSRRLKTEDIDFVGVRFKDDYRFLCNSHDEAGKIMTTLQKCMRFYNLSLSEQKSVTLALPEGLYRPWKIEYQGLSLRKASAIPYPRLEAVFHSVLAIDARLPGTGVIDRFLSELTDRDCELKFQLGEKDRVKAFSLLLLLRQRRSKTFPVVLAIIEALLNKYEEDADLRKHITESLEEMLDSLMRQPNDHEYELVWLIYFTRTVLGNPLADLPEFNSPLLHSVAAGKREFYNSFSDNDLFQMPGLPVSRNHLLRYLEVFRSKQIENGADDE